VERVFRKHGFGKSKPGFFFLRIVPFSQGNQHFIIEPELKGKEVLAGGQGKGMSKGLNSERRKRK
jgi:hypothetical protein